MSSKPFMHCLNITPSAFVRVLAATFVSRSRDTLKKYIQEVALADEAVVAGVGVVVI
jgi:hypothetical protein